MTDFDTAGFREHVKATYGRALASLGIADPDIEAARARYFARTPRDATMAEVLEELGRDVGITPAPFESEANFRRRVEDKMGAQLVLLEICSWPGDLILGEIPAGFAFEMPWSKLPRWGPDGTVVARLPGTSSWGHAPRRAS